MVGFLTARKTDSACFADFLDGKELDKAYPPQPHMCRFVLHSPNQYSAAKRLSKWMERAGHGQDEGAKEEKLRIAAAAEDAVNRTEMHMVTGQPAIFGNIYQLLSPSAGKFLRAERVVAAEDSAAMRCTLVGFEERSKNPWFRLMPGFRSRNEGEPVRAGDTIVLQSVKVPSMYVHCDTDVGDEPDASEFAREHKLNLKDGYGDDDLVREVNISAKPTRFRVVPVATHVDAKIDRTAAVRCGQYCEIYQRQPQAYLYRSPDKHVDGSADIDIGAVQLLRPEEESQEEEPAPTIRADFVWQLEVPMMAWSGVTVQVLPKPQVFCLRDAVASTQAISRWS
jgi:hypothetical protein